MVDEHVEARPSGMRSYADFAHTSPIPNRKDGHHFTPRNSMSLVNIAVKGEDALFHFDGEFNSMEDLVRATLTGRNYGWLANEGTQAIKHVAKIIREDEGKGDLAREFGGSYTKILTGSDKTISKEFKLPKRFRINVSKASDKQIFDAVAKLISAYVTDLAFAKDEKDRYNTSPYDQFLIANKLPRNANKGESEKAYAQRLINKVSQLNEPKFIDEKTAKFKTHQQQFVFGPLELQGMKLFFQKGSIKKSGGNCVSCHSAPHFSDFKFHNTGMTQFNYDRTHGFDSFNKLEIPGLTVRNKNYSQYLPATYKHPKAKDPFRSLTNQDKPGLTDLGMWNIFANPDIPAPQKKLKKIVCAQAKQQGMKNCKDERLLPLTIASFKTPVLRNLGHSDPYMHNGEFPTLKEAVSFYMTSSLLAQQGDLRNADPELKHVRILPSDFEPLVAFLAALNEDYE